MADTKAIQSRRQAITSFFNAGGGLFVLSGADNGDGHGGDDLAVQGADGGSHDGQPDLELLHAAGVAAVPDVRELPFKGGRVGDGVRRVALQRLRENGVNLLRVHVRQEDLAGCGSVHRGALPDPVDGGDRR